MKKSPNILRIVRPLGVQWAKYMAYKVGIIKEENKIGRLVNEIGLPFCKKLGEWLIENNYQNHEIDEDFLTVNLF